MASGSASHPLAPLLSSPRAVVVALIGTGWSLLKPFLNDREKRIIIIALAFQVGGGLRSLVADSCLRHPAPPAQVVNNIAIIVVDEMAPGSIAFDQWIYVLHIAGEKGSR